jgi:hypothetical protein
MEMKISINKKKTKVNILDIFSECNKKKYMHLAFLGYKLTLKVLDI